MHYLASTIFVITVFLVVFPTQTYAFGAGEIPNFAYLNGKAFRHGDIEDILSELAKTVGSAAGGTSLLGFAQSLLSAAAGGAKFSHEDVKKVYFGNWLRDYSQAMDIAGLSKLSADTLVLIVSVLGFLTFGFATEEYQVTADRLGVYLPVEHIDNPKGYAEKEGDARQFHPKLRPPVNPRELEIDPRTGMKNYMATEGRGWDTSTAHIRRTFRACIERGRRAEGREGADLWEAYRFLGTGLHTMEDLLAHSNWCELALHKMGYTQIFCHVGDDVLINTPNGETHPLVTGTFGSADFLHSLMGEATDHLSQASVVDLSKNLANAAQTNTDSSLLRSLLKKLPIGGSGDDEDKVSQADSMQAQAKAYRFDPDNVMPPEVQRQMFELLKWRDGIYRDILKKIEMVPGLETLIDNLTDALNAFVYTILAPYLTPILQQVTTVLSEGSKAVIDSDDQYEVFNDPNASDPSHSLLSKDHFALILNEPAGKIAQIVVRYSVNLIVNAWFDQRQDPDRVIDQILEAFHHPYYNVGRSRIQQEMFEEMEKWIGSLGPEESESILNSLAKESVRAGKNKRQGSDDDMNSSNQVYGQTNAQTTQSLGQGEGGSGYPSHSSQRDGYRSSTHGGRTSYGGGQDEDPYATSTRPTYNAPDERDTYSSSYGQDTSDGNYGRTQGRGEYEQTYGRQTAERYGVSDEQYGSGRDQSAVRTEPDYSQESSYGREGGQRHGRRHHQQAEEEPSFSRGYNPSYTTTTTNEYETPSYTATASSEYKSTRPQYADESYGSRREHRRDQVEHGDYDRRERTTSSAYVSEPTYTRGYEEQPASRYGGGDESYTQPSYEPSSRYDSGGYGREQEGYRRGDGEEGERHSSRRHHQAQEYTEDREADRNQSYGQSDGRYGQDEYGQETFGAERLTLNDENEERPRHGHHHKKHHQDEY